jgi:hypothetical protein
MVAKGYATKDLGFMVAQRYALECCYRFLMNAALEVGSTDVMPR